MEYRQTKIESNKKDIKVFKNDIDVIIVNGLKFMLNCQIEKNGNQLTIWITESQEK